MREGFRKGQPTDARGTMIIPNIDAAESARAATARNLERDLAGRTPASHAGAGLEAVMAIAAVESSLQCGRKSGTEADQRGAVA